MSLKLVRLQERLSWLSKLLTQPNLEEKVNHYERTQLLEEVEHLEEEKKEIERTVCRS